MLVGIVFGNKNKNEKKGMTPVQSFLLYDFLMVGC